MRHIYVLTYQVADVGEIDAEAAESMSEKVLSQLPKGSRLLTLINDDPECSQPKISLECINPVYITEAKLKEKYQKLIEKAEQSIK